MTATRPATAPGWGVGCYEGAQRRVPWEISHDEMRRDIGAAPRVLAALGVTTGTRVLLCSMLAEAGQWWPLTVGVMLSGAQLSCADANEGDALRVAMFTSRIEYHAVLGVTGAILDGLDALGRDYADVFGGITVIGARPDAYARLRTAGLAPHHFVCCGPALAIAHAPDAPARYDTDEWRLDVDGDREGDRVLVTNLRPRATTFARTPTAVHGVLTSGGLVPTTTTTTTTTTSREERA
jgi:hypothetical protein